MIAALAADEDRDYGELELNDTIVSLLIKFEEIAFEVSTEEWKQGVEAEPEINFSAAATAGDRSEAGVFEFADRRRTASRGR